MNQSADRRIEMQSIITEKETRSGIQYSGKRLEAIINSFLQEVKIFGLKNREDLYLRTQN